MDCARKRFEQGDTALPTRAERTDRPSADLAASYLAPVPEAVRLRRLLRLTLVDTVFFALSAGSVFRLFLQPVPSAFVAVLVGLAASRVVTAPSGLWADPSRSAVNERIAFFAAMLLVAALGLGIPLATHGILSFATVDRCVMAVAGALLAVAYTAVRAASASVFGREVDVAPR